MSQSMYTGYGCVQLFPCLSISFFFIMGRFNQILAVRSYSHLAVVFKEYSKVRV